jgi:hypothetical protein
MHSQLLLSAFSTKDTQFSLSLTTTMETGRFSAEPPTIRRTVLLSAWETCTRRTAVSESYAICLEAGGHGETRRQDHGPASPIRQTRKNSQQAKRMAPIMDDQRIEAPNESDVDGIARAVLHAKKVIAEALGSELTGSKADLLLIQQLLDSGTVEREATYTLQALGLAFGMVFIDANPDYDWCMVEDNLGRDPAIRYKRTSLLAYPRTMISKRIEDGECVNVAELFDGLCRRMAELVERGWH